MGAVHLLRLLYFSLVLSIASCSNIIHHDTGCRSASHRYVPDAQAIHALQRVATAMEKILAGNSTVLSWLKESSSYQPTPGAWFLANVPLLARALSIEKLQVLKMDCEGCEYALADDILKHDELFLDKVDQFAIEVHTTAMIAKTRDHALALGRLYHLLQEAGLELVHAAVQYCNDEHAAFGHQEEFIAVGYPHTRNDYCQNLLFAKRPRA
ncbi:hypothetical protein WJX75_007780 [Coccomyxa subellipsoidea]|uniref:Methyltransferase domain-containing protein n=1 Tax=Coccomyxa subellipsoidea TaxID=248742 RepID=A0ABR2Z4K0_9CHLO